MAEVGVQDLRREIADLRRAVDEVLREIRSLAAARKPAPAVVAAPTVAPKPTLAPIDVTYGTALAWAAERGLAPAREGMDIERVNARRVQLGLAPFRVIRPVVGARA